MPFSCWFSRGSQRYNGPWCRDSFNEACQPLSIYFKKVLILRILHFYCFIKKDLVKIKGLALQFAPRNRGNLELQIKTFCPGKNSFLRIFLSWNVLTLALKILELWYASFLTSLPSYLIPFSLLLLPCQPQSLSSWWPNMAYVQVVWADGRTYHRLS